jgi:two-component system chemotaxis response regulator CheY
MAIILIVEDRPIDRKLLATILRTRGHEIVEASDGKEALDALKQITPDLVVRSVDEKRRWQQFSSSKTVPSTANFWRRS